MRGIPDFNFPLFNAVTAHLRDMGWEVFNPAERDKERHNGTDIANPTGSLEQAKADHGFSLRQALHDDLAYITLHANTLVLLPGWEKSDGAQAEWRTAIALIPEGMEIGYLDTDTCADILEFERLKASAKKEGFSYV